MDLCRGGIAALAVLGWTLYAVAAGTAVTGCWVAAHECGHGAFSDSVVLRDTVGYVLHTVRPPISYLSLHTPLPGVSLVFTPGTNCARSPKPQRTSRKSSAFESAGQSAFRAERRAARTGDGFQN